MRGTIHEIHIPQLVCLNSETLTDADGPMNAANLDLNVK
jgi:hypothetical protein